MFIGKYKDYCVAHLAVIDDTMKFLTSLVNAVSVGAVDDEDEPLSSCVIVPPEGTDFVLATDVL